jgi:hypothetical protein
MKKQNVNNKLAFGKATVVELNDAQIGEVNGGTTPACAWAAAQAAASSVACVGLAAAAVGSLVAWLMD